MTDGSARSLGVVGNLGQAGRAEVREVRAAPAWALDTREWGLFAGTSADEVDVDLSALGVPAAQDGT